MEMVILNRFEFDGWGCQFASLKKTASVTLGEDLQRYGKVLDMTPFIQLWPREGIQHAIGTNTSDIFLHI